jgi:hypothetical protein
LLTYQIDSISPTHAQAASTLPLQLSIFGGNFTDTQQLKCRLTSIDDVTHAGGVLSPIPIELAATFISVSEIRCAIPAHVVARVWVQVSLDNGAHWTDNNVTLTFFDV